MFAAGVFASRGRVAIMTVATSAVVASVTMFHKQLLAALSKIRKNRIGRITVYAMTACILLAVVYIAVISFLMLNAMSGAPPPPDDVTLIVLGAQVAEYRPSQILRRRMEAALEFLYANPEATPGLSGGVGSQAFISEGEAMRRFLESNGISEDRLFVEDRSTSTRENILFSSILIEEHALGNNVIIVTDGFHQYRAQKFAENIGLSPSALTSRTPLLSLPFYWLREIAAITTQVIFG
jgi:uncharacterized SAM-binding protein YcdF (DUF218 family)